MPFVVPLNATPRSTLPAEMGSLRRIMTWMSAGKKSEKDVESLEIMNISYYYVRFRFNKIREIDFNLMLNQGREEV